MNTNPPPDTTARTFAFTYGASATRTKWTDRRTTTWPELAALLTRHEIGPKVGPCFVPAIFRGTRRHKAAADQIDLAVLDADCGHTAEEIETAVKTHGLAAIIHSTHSHLTTTTTVKKTAWDKFFDECPIDAERLFLIGKGYLPRVAEGARLGTVTAEEVTFEHQPCPKFRIVLRLSRPWRAAEYPTQDAANADWKARIEALAGALGLHHDQSCTDTSRLFYLPRHPGDGRVPVASVIEGEACDIWSLPPATKPAQTDGPFGQKAAATNDSVEFTDPETDKCIDLREWGREYGQRFEIVKALKARKLDIFIGHVAEGAQHHILCVNDDAHTTTGAGRATFIVNASEARNVGFVYHCRHGHCTGHDRLFFVRLMLEQGWLKAEDLTSPAFLVADAEGNPADDIADRAARAVAALVAEFNGRYMVINENGKATIYVPTRDQILKRNYFNRMAAADLRLLYLNRQVLVGADENSNPVYQQAAEVWLRHVERRQFIRGVVFDPSGESGPAGVLNLWQGFGVTPRPGKWNLLREHIFQIICGRYQDRFDYLMNWLARMVQYPAEQGEVAIVMRGGEGTGKGTLARAMTRILGQHGLAISNSKHLTGNFNAHLRDCVFLFADEAFYAGDPSHVGVLKSIITEPCLTIEAKYQNAVQMPNFLHLMMASNEEWVVPAALDARRFFVLEVSGAHANDHDWFGAIWQEMEAGGYAAMLHDLLHHDLAGFNVRRVPVTDGLQEQRTLSLGTSDAWWLDVLHRGYVYRSKLGLESFFGEWHDEMATEVLFASYSDFAKAHGERHPMARETFGRFMLRIGAKAAKPSNAVLGEHIADVERAGYGDTARKAELIRKARATGYHLGPLAQARAAFTTATGLAPAWPDDGAS